MTKEEMRIAIAEACGWRFEKGTTPTYGGTNKPRGWRSPEDGALRRNLPDYLNDLNAMHEAWQTLSFAQKTRACEELRQIIRRGWRDVLASGYDLATLATLTTADKYAEAFLRTLNLWKD